MIRSLSYLTSQTPKFNGFIFAATYEAIFIFKAVNHSDTVSVTGETLQFYLLEIELTVFLASPNLVFPISQPVAS